MLDLNRTKWSIECLFSIDQNLSETRNRLNSPSRLSTPPPQITVSSWLKSVREEERMTLIGRQTHQCISTIGEQANDGKGKWVCVCASINSIYKTFLWWNRVRGDEGGLSLDGRIFVQLQPGFSETGLQFRTEMANQSLRRMEIRAKRILVRRMKRTGQEALTPASTCTASDSPVRARQPRRPARRWCGPPSAWRSPKACRSRSR